MNSTQSLKSQARKLMTELAALGNPLKYQDALDIIARLNNHRDWQHAAPALEALPSPPTTSVKPSPAGFLAELPEIGDAYKQQEVPGTGWLYHVPVTAEYTKTAFVAVRATSVDEALLLARELAADGKVTLVEDEGNSKTLDDFYIPDDSSDGVYRLPTSEAALAVETCRGAQVGPYLVELEALGHDEYVACLAYFDPDQEEGVAIRRLSGIPLSTGLALRVATCSRIAQALFQQAPSGFESAAKLDNAFIQLLG